MENYNFKDVVRGDSFGVKEITILSNAVALDLTGVEIRSQFREKTKVGALVKTLTNTDGIDVYDPVNGLFRVDDFLVDWPAGIYYYDFQFTFPDGSVKTYFGGYIKVIQDVTQNP